MTFLYFILILLINLYFISDCRYLTFIFFPYYNIIGIINKNSNFNFNLNLSFISFLLSFFFINYFLKFSSVSRGISLFLLPKYGLSGLT